jgi:hypothetical protein
MDDNLDYEALPESAGHGIHMFAGALVSKCFLHGFAFDSTATDWPRDAG